MIALTRRLMEAAEERNWEALSRVDGEVAAALPGLLDQGALSAAERSALDEVQRAHLHAGNACSAELATLAQRLEDMRANHSGWRAYAALEEDGK